MERTFVLRGDICYSKSPTQLHCVPDGYLVSIDGISQGVFSQLPSEYAQLPLRDWRGHLVVPGLTDLHVHGPQYTFRGQGMDLELLEWLETQAFPEESKYTDLDYARRAYRVFVDALTRSATTRACVFATAHTDATVELMNQLEESGLVTMVGRVNMDRHAPDSLREPDAHQALEETRRWLTQTLGQYQRTTPILTPRFLPTCSNELMAGLQEIQAEFGLAVQSHLSENKGEQAWVQSLYPNSTFYGENYANYGMFGGTTPTIMAHCVLSSPEEVALMKEQGVYVAHCPQSNANLASGVAPVRRYLDEGLHVGFGSDVAGGAHLSIFRAMADGVQHSKLRWRMQDQSLKPLTLPEVFWMGTMGGGSFFGKVGSFEPQYELDALVLAEDDHVDKAALTLPQRLERAVYLSHTSDIRAKFVQGRQIF